VLHPCDYQLPSLVDDVMHQRASVARGWRDRDAAVVGHRCDHCALKEHSVPFVRIAPAEHENDLHSVYTNDRESSARMTEQLALLGHRRIGFIIGNPDHAAVADRYSGYRDGLKSSGLQLDKKLVVQGYNSFSSGVECGRKLLNLPSERRPTAIFASNDEMAAGVLALAHGMDLRYRKTFRWRDSTMCRSPARCGRRLLPSNSQYPRCRPVRPQLLLRPIAR